MLPILLAVGPLKIYSFGFLVFLGFSYFVFVAWRRLRELGLNQEKIIDFVILLALFGVVGARVFFGLIAGIGGQINFKELMNINRLPGLSLTGAVIGGVIAVKFFTSKNRWDMAKVADELVVAFGPMMVLWYIGSFLSGSFVGRPTTAFWGLFFPGDLIRRQPVALFGVVWYLIVWLFLVRIERTWRTWKWYRSKRSGLIALIFLGMALAGGFGLAFLTENDLYLSAAAGILALVGVVGVVGAILYRSGIKIKYKNNQERVVSRTENIKQ